MVIAEPGWLHTAGQIAGTLLLLELGLVLVVLAALMIVLVVGVVWLRQHVVPVLDEYAPKALEAMAVARNSSEKVVNGVAEFYGRRQQIETGLRVLLFGRQAARGVHDTSLAKASADLDLMSAPEETPSPENDFTPRLRTGETEPAAAGARQQPAALESAPRERPARARGDEHDGSGAMNDLASNAG
jgi:hypothetical protein